MSATRERSSLKKNLLLTLGTVLFVLVLLEVGIRVADHVSAESLTLPFDHERYREDVWLVAHRSLPGVLRSEYKHHPVLGWVPRAGYRTPGLTINSATIRSTSEIPLEKPVGIARIGLFGDSFTFGENVKDQETFSFLLQQCLPHTEVINFGVPGYGADQMLLRYRELGSKYHLDKVIVVYYLPDIHRDVVAFRDYRKPVFRLKKGELSVEGVPIPDREEMIKILEARPPKEEFPPWYTSHFSKFVQLRLHRWRSQIGTYDYDLDLTSAILSAFEGEVEKDGGQFCLVLVPREEDVTDPQGGLYRKIEDSLVAWAETSGVSALNLRPALCRVQSSTDEAIWAGHWTPVGHRVVAGEMEKWIVNGSYRDGVSQVPGT